MELKRDEIIKALECCTYGGDFNKSQVEVCSPCPYFTEGNCTDVLKENALFLINELIEGIKSRDDTISRFVETMPLVKADTLRELQIRLTREVGTYLSISIIKVEDMFKLIDQIVEEMIGEAK